LIEEEIYEEESRKKEEKEMTEDMKHRKLTSSQKQMTLEDKDINRI
jgi:hypothetical protein